MSTALQVGFPRRKLSGSHLRERGNETAWVGVALRKQRRRLVRERGRPTLTTCGRQGGRLNRAAATDPAGVRNELRGPRQRAVVAIFLGCGHGASRVRMEGRGPERPIPLQLRRNTVQYRLAALGGPSRVRSRGGRLFQQLPAPFLSICQVLVHRQPPTAAFVRPRRTDVGRQRHRWRTTFTTFSAPWDATHTTACALRRRGRRPRKGEDGVMAKVVAHCGNGVDTNASISTVSYTG